MSFQISINGENKTLEHSVSLKGLIEQLGMDPSFIAIALNTNVIPKSELDQVTIQEGDVLEIVKPVGGG